MKKAVLITSLLGVIGILLLVVIWTQLPLSTPRIPDQPPEPSTKSTGNTKPQIDAKCIEVLERAAANPYRDPNSDNELAEQILHESCECFLQWTEAKRIDLATVNFKGNPLTMSASKDDGLGECLQAMLNAGADVNHLHPNTEFYLIDFAYDYAAYKNVALLLKHGANKSKLNPTMDPDYTPPLPQSQLDSMEEEKWRERCKAISKGTTIQEAEAGIGRAIRATKGNDPDHPLIETIAGQRPLQAGVYILHEDVQYVSEPGQNYAGQIESARKIALRLPFLDGPDGLTYVRMTYPVEGFIEWNDLNKARLIESTILPLGYFE